MENCKVIAITNQKGGVGWKSLLILNLRLIKLSIIHRIPTRTSANPAGPYLSSTPEVLPPLGCHKLP